MIQPIPTHFLQWNWNYQPLERLVRTPFKPRRAFATATKFHHHRLNGRAMYPYFRLIRMVLRHALQRKKAVDWSDEYCYHYRPLIGDLDVYPEVNNGRHFVMFDMARIDLAFQVGLVRYLRKNKLAFVVGGSSIRYRRRVRPFRKATIRTTMVGFDEKFFYFQQLVEQGGLVCSAGLLRTALRYKGGMALPSKVMEELGFEAQAFMEPWVSEWATWDDQRPWPEPRHLAIEA